MQSNDNLFKVSEVFRSIQGEGPSAGQACLFLRLATCNLHCQWCDTPYSWDYGRFDYAHEVRLLSVAGVAHQIHESGERRLVITGGEPLMQQALLASLLQSLSRDLRLEVETNGTITPNPQLLKRVDQWNVSPKLSNSGEPRERRLRPKALDTLLKTQRAWLKLVIANDADAQEAAELVTEICWPKERVLFMPQAANVAELHTRAPGVAHASLQHGFGYSPRLHLDLFQGKRGH